jgi:hypothetical protein
MHAAAVTDVVETGTHRYSVEPRCPLSVFALSIAAPEDDIPGTN